ncbi:ABC-type oligopeptide transport system, periplasmic component, partial [human gut metagenome]
EVTPLGLNFFIEDNHITDFTDGTSQSIVLSGSKAKSYLNKNYIYDEFSTAVYGITMNTSNSIFKSDKLRYALLYATDTAELEMPFGYTVADGAVPPSVKNSLGSYRDAVGGKAVVKPDEIKAYTAYQSACANIDKADLYSVNIIAVENRDEEIGESVKGILQQWQAKLGMYCSISYISESEYDEKLKNGDYTLALTRL